MAQIVVTLRIMPESPEVDLHRVESDAKSEIKNFCHTQQFKTSIEPVAFGLNVLNIIFTMDESIGSTEELEKNIQTIDGVNSVEVSDVRRAVG